MLEVTHLYKSYAKSKRWFEHQRQEVVCDVSFKITEGTCVGLVGESGSGKSTVARLILGIEKADSGQIVLNKQNASTQNQSLAISVVFQDYLSSVNPHMNVSQIVLEAYDMKRQKIDDRHKKVIELLDTVGLPAHIQNAYPHELSGGQLQRVCIARALSTRPRLIVLDEPTSSLDVLNQIRILDLLKKLKAEFGLTYLFISHDLQAVSYISDEIIFFKQGRIIEQVATQKLAHVQTPYAQELLAAVIC